MVFEHSVVKTKHICKETENSYSSASNSQTQSQVESSHSKDRSGHAGPWAVGVLLNVLLRLCGGSPIKDASVLRAETIESRYG